MECRLKVVANKYFMTFIPITFPQIEDHRKLSWNKPALAKLSDLNKRQLKATSCLKYEWMRNFKKILWTYNNCVKQRTKEYRGVSLQMVTAIIAVNSRALLN